MHVYNKQREILLCMYTHRSRLHGPNTSIMVTIKAVNMLKFMKHMSLTHPSVAAKNSLMLALSQQLDRILLQMRVMSITNFVIITNECKCMYSSLVFLLGVEYHAKAWFTI